MTEQADQVSTDEIQRGLDAVATTLRDAVARATRNLSRLQAYADRLEDDHAAAYLRHNLEWTRLDLEDMTEMAAKMGQHDR